MKSYMQFLIGLAALSSGSNMVASTAEREVEEGIQGLKLHTSELQMSSGNIDEDEIDKFGERMLSGKLDKGEIDKIGSDTLQEIMDWIQDKMYRGVAGFYSNNQFIKIAKGLESENGVKLERTTVALGKKKEKVEYISKITLLDEEKTKNYLQDLNDATAEYNKKYPYREE